MVYNKEKEINPYTLELLKQWGFDSMPEDVRELSPLPIGAQLKREREARENAARREKERLSTLPIHVPGLGTEQTYRELFPNHRYIPNEVQNPSFHEMYDRVGNTIEEQLAIDRVEQTVLDKWNLGLKPERGITEMVRVENQIPRYESVPSGHDTISMPGPQPLSFAEIYDNVEELAFLNNLPEEDQLETLFTELERKGKAEEQKYEAHAFGKLSPWDQMSYLVHADETYLRNGSPTGIDDAVEHPFFAPDDEGVAMELKQFVVQFKNSADASDYFRNRVILGVKVEPLNAEIGLYKVDPGMISESGIAEMQSYSHVCEPVHQDLVNIIVENNGKREIRFDRSWTDGYSAQDTADEVPETIKLN